MTSMTTFMMLMLHVRADLGAHEDGYGFTPGLIWVHMSKLLWV